MVFSSYIFLFAFLPVTFCCYHLLMDRLKSVMAAKVFLVVACLFFYGWFNWNYLWIICLSMLVNYLDALAMQKLKGWRRNSFFIAGVVFNLLLIGYFKYRDFLLDSINILAGTHFPLLRLLLPLGISFFTFQQISYLMDIHAGRLEVHYNLLDYMLFVTFFPQLIAGPIVLPGEMMPQFANAENHRLIPENCAKGLWLFSIGMAKKLLLADFFAVMADGGFATKNLDLLLGWRTALSYTLQIYFDFSGYSDMAIGLGLLFNIRLPLNFNSPYQAENIRDFWQRWHITLGRFLTNFVYIPLGGNRHGHFRTLLNLLLTFLASGLWHGAGWLFVLWGLMHGIAICLQRIWSWGKLPCPRWLGRILTFLFVLFAWVIFRAPTLESAGRIYSAMLDFKAISQVGAMCANFSRNNATMLLLGLLMAMLCRDPAAVIERFRFNRWTAAATILLLLLSIFSMNKISPFIYFNF